MARVEYIDGRACHVMITPDDIAELEVTGSIVVPADRPDVPRALVVRLGSEHEVPACP